jgi:hypothetical protein
VTTGTPEIYDQSPADEMAAAGMPLENETSSVRRRGRAVARILANAVVGIAVGWSTFALWFDASRDPWVSRPVACLFVAACIALATKLRPTWRALAALSGLAVLVFGWWMLIPARNDRDWTPDAARLAHGTIAGNRLTIRNVRNFDYRSLNDFTERWETRSYNLDELRGVDLYVSYFGSRHIAHTIASWDFANGPPLAISIEARKEKGESYSPLRGLFRQYELYYVVADERDVIRVRTNCRGESVYLYRIRMTPENARILLMDYLGALNSLTEKPLWYNSVSTNCSTTMRHHVLNAGGYQSWNWRILLNGHIDELCYSLGAVDTELPFADLRSLSEINGRAQAGGDMPDFSERIRIGIPERD